MRGYLINLRGRRISKVATTDKDINKLRQQVTVKGRRRCSNVLVIEE